MAGARISIRLQPGAGRNELAGIRDGALVVRVTAPPLEGRANKALVKLLAKTLGVAPSRLTIVLGEHAREKLVEVADLDQAELDSRIADALPTA